MPEHDIGQEILEGIREIKDFKLGGKNLNMKDPAPPQVILGNHKQSQAAFAGLMSVSIRTVQDWEQGRRKPSGPAAALSRIAEQNRIQFWRKVDLPPSQGPFLPQVEEGAFGGSRCSKPGATRLASHK